MDRFSFVFVGSGPKMSNATNSKGRLAGSNFRWRILLRPSRLIAHSQHLPIVFWRRWPCVASRLHTPHSVTHVPLAGVSCQFLILCGEGCVVRVSLVPQCLYRYLVGQYEPRCHKGRTSNMSRASRLCMPLDSRRHPLPAWSRVPLPLVLRALLLAS